MIVVSNGHSNFPLRFAAAEAAARDRLALFITGAYPGPRLSRRLGRFPLRGRPARLGDRVDAIPIARVRALWASELVAQAGLLGRRLQGRRAWSEWLIDAGMDLYARQSVRLLEGGARIFHYRAGFGRAAVARARSLGMVAICEHSIAHPAVLHHLVAHEGRMPSRQTEFRLLPIWRAVLDDAEQADRLVVNSEFVKTTFVHMGWSPARIEVIRRGIDERFLGALAAAPPRRSDPGGPLEILFAGSFEPRKGIDALMSALTRLDDLPWRLTIAGPIAHESARRHARMLGDARIQLLGTLPRAALAHCMARAEVFCFPSLAEGAARVVLEALAAGCYTITTANAGSIVIDGVHGALVDPGDADALVRALRTASGDRARTARIGADNARRVLSDHRQHHYGVALMRFYDHVLAAPRAAA